MYNEEVDQKDHHKLYDALQDPEPRKIPAQKWSSIRILPCVLMNERQSMSRITRKPLRKSGKSVSDDIDEADVEDMEIRRLEKLLKIDSKKRKISAEKLNKEFEENEGIDGNFGDFLLGLDDLSNGIVKYKKLQSSNHLNQDKATSRSDSTLINDDSVDEQEMEQEDDASNSASSQAAFEEEEKDEDAEEESSRHASDKMNAHDVYQPVAGQDIYGRITDASKASHSAAKYVPPAKRKLVIDDTVGQIFSN